MGVVYKAEDTKLERTVALKFLSLTSIADEEKKRFKREAKAAASLNHPNIATIFAIDEVDDQTFIAMEFIEGKSLQEIVGANGGSPMPIDKAIDYATQTAAGLQAAHEKGITHRDIKSANIMVTDKGQIKIMDFGLAKLANRSKLTQLGTTLGTAAYMSPEQSRGENTDHRSDIWSLGVVLYEMISGQMPFKGDYEQAVIYSIQNEDAEPLTALRSGVPIALDGIIAKALAKDAKTRYQHVDELPADLRAIDAASLSRTKISMGHTATLTMSKPDLAKTRLPWLLFAIAAIVALIFAFDYFGESSQEPQTVRSSLLPPANVSFWNDQVPGGQIALSADGSRLTFVAADSIGKRFLWVRHLNTLTARQLAGTKNARYPFWSPDARFIGFFAGGKLKKIAASGGPALTLCDAPEGRGGTWSRDDVIVFSPTNRGALHQVSASGGETVPVTQLDSVFNDYEHRWPQFLPDGKRFLYFARTISDVGGDNDAICVATLARGPQSRKRLLHARSDMAYAKGHLLYIRENALIAQPLDVEALQIKGQALLIAERMQFTDIFHRGVFSASQNGLLVYQTQREIILSQLVLLNRKGQKVDNIGEPANYRSARLSNDGARIALEIVDEVTSSSDIWVYDMARLVRTRLTFDARVEGPVWSPDDKRIAFSWDTGTGVKLYQQMADGTGTPELLWEKFGDQFVTDWSSDGRFIGCYVSQQSRANPDLWILPVTDKQKPFVFLNTRFAEQGLRFSHNMRWVAYRSNESGRSEIYVSPFAPQGQSGKWQVSTQGGRGHRWRGDSKEIFYVSPDNKIMAREVRTSGEAFEMGAVRTLFELAPENSVYDITKDGQLFLVAVPVADQTLAPLTLVVNWDEELKRK